MQKCLLLGVRGERFELSRRPQLVFESFRGDRQGRTSGGSRASSYGFVFLEVAQEDRFCTGFTSSLCVHSSPSKPAFGCICSIFAFFPTRSAQNLKNYSAAAPLFRKFGPRQTDTTSVALSIPRGPNVGFALIVAE